MIGKHLTGYGTKAKQHFFRSLDLHYCITPADDHDAKFTGTKLVCSLGPSSHTVPVLEAMLHAGMVAARIDLTWGGLDFHRKTLQALNTAMMNTKKLCAIVLDTLGREIMVRRPCEIGPDGWPAHPRPMEVTAGQQVTLTTRQDVEATSSLLPVTYPYLHQMCEEGDTIYIGRYLVSGSDTASLYLKVVSVEEQDIVCEAQNGAIMDGLMTVFHMERSAEGLLNLQNNLPLLSDYDKEAIAALGTEFEIDFIQLAFTRTREDLREARNFLDSLGLVSTRILAKLETRQALLNFRGILALADGIVVSRGNIGLDVAPEKMALVQKQLINHCNLMGKPVLITRVVDSMVTAPRPTRAEATDIANAVLDGVDGILLGAETLRGSHPVEAVATIAQICRVAEAVFDHSSHYDHLMSAAQEMENVVRVAAHTRGHDDAPSRAHKKAEFEDEDMINSDSPIGSSADVPSLGTGPSPAHHFSAAGSFTNLKGLMQSSSYASLAAAYQEVHSFTVFGGAGSRSVAANLSNLKAAVAGKPGIGPTSELPFMNMLEALSSSAVRVADKVAADLIIVYTATGRTAQLVAKYRPPMPILTLVVPRIVSDGIHWKLEGKATARACQLTRGLLPMLATPGPNGDAVLEAAVLKAADAGLVAPKHHVVVLQQIHNDLCVKVLTLDARGSRVSGPKKVKQHISSAVGQHIGALYPKSPAPSFGLRGVGNSTGDMVDSDAESDDDDDEVAAGLWQRGLVPLLGDLQASASMLYDDESAKSIAAAVHEHMSANIAALKPQVGVMKP